MDILTTLGLVIPAGLNAYIPLLVVAIAERADLLTLRAPLNQIGEWWAIALIVVLLLVEIFADKVPGLDHVNNAIQTVMRPAAGALIAVSTTPASSHIDPALLIFAGIVVAGGVHAVKSVARPVVHATTGGVATPVVSAAEDIWAAIMSILAVLIPVLVVVAILALAIVAWVLIRRRKRKKAAAAAAAALPPPDARGPSVEQPGDSAGASSGAPGE